MTTASCPDRSQLAAFAQGRLPEQTLQATARHVERCPSCTTHLEDVGDEEDDLAQALRRLPGESRLQEPVGEELLREARSALLSSGTEPVFDHGQRFSRALESGPVRIGHFELRHELGTGSFGHVFLARDTELDRPVAIKIQRSGILTTDEERDRFRREARSTALLKHAGIVSIFEIGETDDGVLYLATEYVPGTSLEQRIEAGPVAHALAARIVAGVAEALDYAHAQGVVHRDVKPSNVMLDEEGLPHLMDFGLAKREGGGSTVTRAGTVMGTPAYMSPEQARGDSHGVDARTDIYSLGVVLYELLTGQRPFQGRSRMLLLQVLEDDPRPPHRLDHRVPRDLEVICLKAMSRAPGRRYATAGMLAADLRRHLAGEPIRARPLGPARKLLRWSRRNPLAAALIAAITLGAGVGLWSMSRLSESLVQESVYEGARMQADILEELNDFYSEIVGQLDPGNVDLTHRFAGRRDALPLPATFTIEAGRRISRSESGMQVRLYSDYPFPWRKYGGPRDAFEREALLRLERDPSSPVHAFTELEGRPVIRYARARLMKPSCIACHNNRPDTPRNDWKVGDVRGVLEIIRPLDREHARSREGLWSTFLILFSSLGLALLLSILLLNRRRRRVDS